MWFGEIGRQRKDVKFATPSVQVAVGAKLKPVMRCKPCNYGILTSKIFFKNFFKVIDYEAINPVFKALRLNKIMHPE